MKTILEDAWDEVQNVCGIWVYETLGAEFDRLAAELFRYKQGVEVEGYVIGVPRDIDANLYFASGWSRELGKLRGKARVLVMKVEEER